MPNRDTTGPTLADRTSCIGAHKQERVTFSCSDCSDFELEKQYTGVSGTDAEREYEEIQPPDECPVCGGEIDEETVSN